MTQTSACKKPHSTLECAVEGEFSPEMCPLTFGAVSYKSFQWMAFCVFIWKSKLIMLALLSESIFFKTTQSDETKSTLIKVGGESRQKLCVFFIGIRLVCTILYWFQMHDSDSIIIHMTHHNRCSPPLHEVVFLGHPWYPRHPARHITYIFKFNAHSLLCKVHILSHIF